MDANYLSEIAQTLAVFIVACIQSSCGDLIQADIANNRLVTGNSKPSRIWDFIYSQIYTNVPSPQYRVDLVRRGPWEMVLLLDTKTKLLITVMREQRYGQLCRMAPEERRFHYVRALAACLNKGLISIEKQMSLFDNSTTVNEDEMDVLQLIVSDMFADMDISQEQVKHHALVLFDVPRHSYEVQSVRCAMVDGDFDIIEEKSWNQYLLFTESVIPDTIVGVDAPHDNPSRGLRLTDKALRKKGDNLPKEIEAKDQDKETEN